MAKVPDMNITVTVEGLPDLDTVIREERTYYNSQTDEGGWKQVTFADEIVSQATHRLLAGKNGEELRKRIEAITNEEIRTTVRDLLAANLAKGFRKTNTYGEPTGEPTSLTEVLADEFHRAMQGSGKGYDRKAGLLEKLIHEQVERVFGSELKPVIEQAKKDAKAAVEKKAAEFIAAAALSMKNV